MTRLASAVLMPSMALGMLGCTAAPLLPAPPTRTPTKVTASVGVIAQQVALTPSGSQEVLHGLAYGPGPRMKLDVYRPIEAAPPAGWPTVIFFYGGSWNTRERRDYAFVGEALASRGIMAVLADYRLYPEVRFPDFLRDSATALAWGLDNASKFGGDRKRVFVMGHSAGAYNAAMLALDSRWLAANAHSPSELAGFIGLAGPYDFLPIENRDVQPVFFHPSYPTGSQPITYASASAPRSSWSARSRCHFVGWHRCSTS